MFIPHIRICLKDGCNYLFPCSEVIVEVKDSWGRSRVEITSKQSGEPIMITDSEVVNNIDFMYLVYKE